jgi:hypothetical protein
MSTFPDPSSQVQAYLGIQLDSQHKYIKVSQENKTLLVKDSIVDDIAKSKKQIQLFERVIDKLTNTTGYKQYSSIDPKMDAKAEVITGVFFENCKKSGCALPELLTFHRIALANLLKYHIQTCLMAPSYQAREKLQIPTNPSSSETTSITPRPRSNTEEEVIVSPSKSQTTLSSSNPSVGNRLQETNPLSPRPINLSKENPGSVKDRTRSTKTSINPPSLEVVSIAPPSFNDLSPEEATTIVRTASFKSESSKRPKSVGKPSKPSPLNRGRSQEVSFIPHKPVNLNLKNLDLVKESIVAPTHHRKLEMSENAQELVAKHLSEGCLSYCYYYWLYRLTNDEGHKYLREQNEKKISYYDHFHLFNDNEFLAEPKLKIILQELTLRALNTAEKNYRVFVDVDRTFGYTAVCRMYDKDSFQYENIEIADQVQIAQHNLLQFERFLLFVIKSLEGDDSLTIQTILSIWKTCVKYATEKNITNESFLNVGEKFLYEIADHSRMQEERGIKFKLRKLISTFHQIIYTVPAAALTASLFKIKCSQSIHNRCNIIKFITPSKVEICVRNTIKFSTNKRKDFVNLTMENKLSADLSDFTSWSSEITAQAVPSSQANKAKFEKLVIEPLRKIGLEVHQPKPLTLRKTNIEASSSSSSAADTDKNSSTS